MAAGTRGEKARTATAALRENAMAGTPGRKWLQVWFDGQLGRAPGQT